jgi:hypothetical protein
MVVTSIVNVDVSRKDLFVVDLVDEGVRVVFLVHVGLKVRVGEVVQTLECFVLDVLVDLGDVDGWTCVCDDWGVCEGKVEQDGTVCELDGEVEGDEGGIEVGDDGDVGKVLTERGDVRVWWMSHGWCF